VDPTKLENVKDVGPGQSLKAQPPIDNQHFSPGFLYFKAVNSGNNATCCGLAGTISNDTGSIARKE